MLGMLNPFPELLVLGLLAPFILRFSFGLILLASGWRGLSKENRGAAVIQLAPSWAVLGTYFVWYITLAEIVAGIMLVLGFLTQIAALIGIILMLNLFFVRKQLTAIAPQSISFYILAVAICLSLLLSGAGTLAIDLPL